jgi:hypothetical protein
MQLRRIAIAVLAAAILAPSSAMAGGQYYRERDREVRREIREGRREIARERREMRRDILNADSPWEARQAIREGAREIARERREMRREVRREIRERW